MRGKPWTLGEVLSGGIGGWVHRFAPGGPCYGCVASFLQRTVTEAPPESLPDYSSPNTAIPETTIPASKASIEVIASLHSLATLEVLAHRSSADLYTSLLFSLQRVPKFSIRRSDRSVIRSPDRPIVWSVPSMRRSTWGAIWMWRWIKHWADWLRYDRLPLSRLRRGGSSIHIRHEIGVESRDALPVPWWADSVTVEAQLRLPANARRKGDFLLQFPDMAPLAAEVVRPEHGTRHRIVFRFPPPGSTTHGVIVWKRQPVAEVVVPVLTANQFLSSLTLESSAIAVRYCGGLVPARSSSWTVFVRCWRRPHSRPPFPSPISPRSD